MTFQTFFSPIIVIALSFSLTACDLGSWWDSDSDSTDPSPQQPYSTEIEGMDSDEAPEAPASDMEQKTQKIQTSWISFEVPHLITVPHFELTAELTNTFSNIEIIWSHPGSGQREAYNLQQFKEGDREAIYKAQTDFRNLLPGLNRYELIARLWGDDPAVPEEERKIDFEVTFDLSGYTELSPEQIQLTNLPDETEREELILEGRLSSSAAQLKAYSYHAKTGQATFANLVKFSPGDEVFSYTVKQIFGNYFPGLNTYIIEALDDDGLVMSRKAFEITFLQKTLADEVKSFFGDFESLEGGWYQSSTYPWFSLRPVYEGKLPVAEDGRSVFPRPTLLYTAESSRETPLCDYLKTLDYEGDDYIYKGFSYEKCQTFRHGVSVYDRFLSILETEAIASVPLADYDEVVKTVSSAFLMLETAGMKATESDRQGLDFNGNSFASDTDAAGDDAMRKEQRHYLYQMLIAQDIDYPEQKIGAIAEEMTDQQVQDFERVKGFLNRHTGDEMFTEILFPSE